MSYLYATCRPGHGDGGGGGGADAAAALGFMFSAFMAAKAREDAVTEFDSFKIVEVKE